jgi:hypothetical protein
VGTLGPARAVVGFEIDATYGLTGNVDNHTPGGMVRSGARGSFDLNTDVVNIIEVKWLYVEFPVPYIPTVVRVGAQPWAATYKTGTLATGDFAGINLVTTFTPNIRWHLAYAQIEEKNANGIGTMFPLSDDFAIVTSVEVTPFKGLDLRPIYAFAYIEGGLAAGNVAARQFVGQFSPVNVFTPLFCQQGTTVATAAQVGGVASDPPLLRDACLGQTSQEYRHTVGIDARWTKGPFSVRPTFFYQFGTRDQINPIPNSAGVLTHDQADISAWFADVIGGWRIGPLLLEARGMWTSGNRPEDNLSKNVNYYQPISTDTGYGADGWGNIFALGIDYFNGAFRTLGTGIGWDRYGRTGGGLKATYSFTPSFDVYALGQSFWTARDVSIQCSAAIGGNRCPNLTTNIPLPGAHGAGANFIIPQADSLKGTENWLGVEVATGLTWRFLPGLAFDLTYSHLFAGDALSYRLIDGTKKDAMDVDTAVARVRFTF